MKRMAARRRKTSNKAGSKPGKDRILDAAERLFARHGFYGVSVRDITKAAEVDVALVSYHFGGKRELFASVFQRRA
jgi:AcrR family transcriptional regulator